MKFYIETYGCTSNFGNSQDVAEALEEKGHVPSSPEEADAVIVNTCAVTEKTERKILRRLSLLQGKRLVIAGCLSTALPESIRQISCRDRLGLLNRSSAEKIADLFRHSVSARPPYILRMPSTCAKYCDRLPTGPLWDRQHRHRMQRRLQLLHSKKSQGQINQPHAY